jgi:ABC-type phosphate/phosphonate transport system substrate-binding protein
MRKVLGAVLTAALSVGVMSQAWADLKLGVIAPRGEAVTMAQWSPFAKYLESQMGEPVKLIPVVLGKLEEAITSGSVDYAVLNPVHAVSVKERLGSELLASLVLSSGAQFGGVIIANPKAGIAKAADLKGKKVMGLVTSAAGGYLFQAYEAKKAGLKVPEDFAAYQVARKQDDTVLAVKAGLMDAGFIRTGILEDMIKEGKVKADDVTVVERKEGFPEALSTDLYPEWYLIAVTPAGKAAAAKVKAAALAVKPDSEAATAAEIKGFIEPADPSGTLRMMKEMKVPPFDK